MQSLINTLILIVNCVISALKAVVWTVLGPVIRRPRQTFEQSLFIQAPVATVWEMVRSRDMTFPGRDHMRVVAETVDGQPDLERVRCIMTYRQYDVMTRIVEERVEQALLYEILPQGTSPAVIIGRDDYLSTVLTADLAANGGRNGTWVFISRTFTPTRWYSEAAAKHGLRTGLQRYKLVAELAAAAAGAPEDAATTRAFVASQTPLPPPKTFAVSANSIIISVIAVGSFAYLWGWQFAVMVAGIILLHELGHAAAMIMVGIPVRGVYLVPFLGGAALAAAPYERQGQAGFVALMGPGFSLFSTIALVIAGQELAQPLLLRAAWLSALINLINLAPILPLDGGQVIKSALISVSRVLAIGVAVLGSMAGIWLAWTFKDPIIGVFVALGVLTLRQFGRPSPLTPMRWPMALLLIVALLATAAIYAVIIYILQRDGNPPLGW
jgi:Zn-dependent protease